MPSVLVLNGPHQVLAGRFVAIDSATCITQNKHIKSFLKVEKENHHLPESIESCSRRVILAIPVVSSGLFFSYSADGKVKNTIMFNEKRILEQNKKIQEANQAPKDFPNFIREGFQVNVLTSDKYEKSSSGLIYLDIEVGHGDFPKDGQQVTFHYVGYNESGRRIDSTYLQGSPAKIRLGNNALVPGFEEGIHGMKPGGKRRLIIPPELGPPVIGELYKETTNENQGFRARGLKEELKFKQWFQRRKKFGPRKDLEP